jgi:hypothetical protein
MFLSRTSLADWSHGGAYVHNLISGSVNIRPEMGRETPYMEEHSTHVAGLKNIEGGDQRFYNNIFIGNGVGLSSRDNAARPVFMAGNVFLNDAAASRHETNPLCLPDFDPELKLIVDGDTVKLFLTLNEAVINVKNKLVTTEMLGKAAINGLAYKNYDGSLLILDSDYFGKKRNIDDPAPGPFENIKEGVCIFNVRK